MQYDHYGQYFFWKLPLGGTHFGFNSLVIIMNPDNKHQLKHLEDFVMKTIITAVLARNIVFTSRIFWI